MKNMKILTAVSAGFLLVIGLMGFATDKEEIDVNATVGAEKNYLRLQIEQNTGKTVDDKTLQQIQQSLDGWQNRLGKYNNGGEFGPPVFCQVGTQCDDIFTEPPVYCKVQDGEETCNRPGRLLPGE